VWKKFCAETFPATHQSSRLPLKLGVVALD